MPQRLLGQGVGPSISELVFGFPLFGWIGLAAMVALLSVFGQRLGKFDLDIVYGRILKKLERQLAEMEELRA